MIIKIKLCDTCRHNRQGDCDPPGVVTFKKEVIVKDVKCSDYHRR